MWPGVLRIEMRRLPLRYVAPLGCPIVTRAAVIVMIAVVVGVLVMGVIVVAMHGHLMFSPVIPVGAMRALARAALRTGIPREA